MSIEIKAAVICDCCGTRIEGPVCTHSTRGMEGYWDAKRQAEKLHWMINLRYGTTRHICNRCADGPQPMPAETILADRYYSKKP